MTSIMRVMNIQLVEFQVMRIAIPTVASEIGVDHRPSVA